MTRTTPEEERLDALARAMLSGSMPPDLDREPPEDDLDDGIILAWQAGRLDEQTTAQVEEVMASDPEARARALALSDSVVSDEALSRAVAVGPSRGRPAWLPSFAAAAAAVMAVGIWWGTRGEEGPDFSYTPSALLGAAQSMRSPTAPAARPIYLPDNTLMVKLRPAKAQDAAPAVHVFAARAGEALTTRRDFVVESAAGGGLTLSAPARALFGDAFGPWRLFIVLGEVPEGTGGRPEAEARARAPKAQWIPLELEYAPTLPPPGDQP